MLEAYNFIEKSLMSLEYNCLEIYFKDYLQMFPSEIMSTEACKLCTLCMNYTYFSQQARWLRG